MNMKNLLGLACAQMLKNSRSLMEQAARKTRNRINPMRNYLKLLALCAPLAWPVSATAGLAVVNGNFETTTKACLQEEIPHEVENVYQVG